MRAKNALALICVLFGGLAVAPAVEAAVSPRSAQKHGRIAAQVPQPSASQATLRPASANGATMQRVAKRDVTPSRSAARVPTVTAARAHSRADDVRSRRLAASRPAAPTTRLAARPPAVPARTAAIMTNVTPAPHAAERRRPEIVQVAMPAISRPARASTLGTPILPVAQSFGLSCVPFARMATGMDVSGNGGHWWHNAAGRYARGQQPERGSILSFPGSGSMRHGHVAVVSRVVNARTIELDHANWGGPGLRRGQVIRGVVVIDVSDRNDWTAVRHQVGFDSTTFGRTYPTHGFIYNRPVGSRDAVAQQGRFQEVAEATSPHAAQHQRRTAELFGR